MKTVTSPGYISTGLLLSLLGPFIRSRNSKCGKENCLICLNMVWKEKEGAIERTESKENWRDMGEFLQPLAAHGELYCLFLGSVKGSMYVPAAADPAHPLPAKAII